MKKLVFIFGLVIAQAGFAQQVAVDSLLSTKVKTENELKAEKDRLKAEKEKLKAEAKANKAEEKAQKAQEKAQKTQEKAAKEKQKNAERLAKAQKNVMSIQTQISKQETEIANETNKFNMNKVKGKLSPNDEVKYKQRILKKEEALNKLNAKLNKAKSDITKYSN